MENTFYIIVKETPQGTWYNLRVLPTHFCLASGSSLERLGQTIKKYVREFSGEPSLMLRSLSQMTNGGKVAEATLEVRKTEYKEHGREYKDFIKMCIEEVSREKKENFRKKFKSRKKDKGLKLKNDNMVSPKEDLKKDVVQTNFKAKFKFGKRKSQV